MFTKLKQNENCFISSVLGCVAMCVFQACQRERFEKGDFMTKEELEKFGVLNQPYAFIKSNGPRTFGVEKLPDRLFEKDFTFPAVTEDNISEKLAFVESELNNCGIPISFNLYLLANDKVHNKVVSSEKTTTVSRLTSSVIIIQSSNTSKPRNHNTSFNLLLTEEGEGKQFHVAPVLNIGKFIYHNEERFLYEKGAEKLAELINNSTNLLSGDMLGNDPKIWTAKSRRMAHAAVSWQNVFNCNACLTGFLKRARFKEHILHCVGGHVSSMIFEKTPHIEHFESKEFPTTLLCPIVASFDTEACGNKDIERRISRDGTVFKSDSRKEAEMVLSAVVATVIIRPDRAKDFTIYKDTSMSNEELLDTSTVPYPIRRHMEVEDQCNLEMSVDEFRVSMNAFIEVKAKVIKLNVDKIENPNMKISLSEQIETHNKILLRKRTEASRRFGIFFFQLFQILMEYSKKEVAVCCKKTLRLSWKERADLIDPILKSANTFFKNGVLYFVKKIEGEEGEMSTFLEEALTTDNSVTSFKDYNCVICNQKLDPTYLQKMKTYYDHKIQQGEETTTEKNTTKTMKTITKCWLETKLSEFQETNRPMTKTKKSPNHRMSAFGQVEICGK